MRKMCVLSLAALCFLPCDFAQCQTVKVPSNWIGGQPIFLWAKKGPFDDKGVKDATIVNYGGRWHLFYTVSRKDLGGIGYVSADG